MMDYDLIIKYISAIILDILDSYHIGAIMPDMRYCHITR